MSAHRVLRPGHQVGLLRGGAEFFAALIAKVDESQTEVRLETYIFHFDTSGEAVAAALERAAQRGVQVMVVMDAVGTGSVPPAWADRWAKAGVCWELFSPLGRLGLLIPRSWRRLHRKLCVVDGHTAFCGGINILDDWLDPVWGTQSAARFDFAVQVSGPLVDEARALMAQLWGRLQARRQLRQLQWRGVRSSLRQGEVAAAGAVFAHGGVRAALVTRDNLRNRRQIERAYLKAIAEAQHEILLANAYFLPGRRLRHALEHAARRGVRVVLLVQGRYEYFMQYHGSRPVQGALMAAGVQIHAYQTSFLHAKVAVIDSHWATVGSSNLDPLSLLLAREANVVVQDPVFATALRTSLQQAIEKDAQFLDPKDWGQHSLGQRALDYLALALMRALLFVTGRRY